MHNRFTRYVRYICLAGIVLALAWPLGAALFAQGENGDSSVPHSSELKREFDRRRAAIEKNDAQAHYRLGMDMYLRYDGKSKNIEPLELAAEALKTASCIFTVRFKDGTERVYNVEEKDDTWAEIAKDYKPALEDTYQQIYAKGKDRKKRSRQVGQFSAVNRGEVLHKAASNYKKAKSDQKDANLIPVELVNIEASRVYKLVSNELKAVQSFKHPNLWTMAFSVIGGLGIFLIGMKNMSEGVQAVAGKRIRRMINAVTDNRLLAVGVGTGVTCLVQSSSITTVIVVGLVNSGIMALHQAIGVVMGANIGTTITGWILVLKIGKYGLPIIGISVFVYLFSKKDRWRYLALTAMGLGMVFFGLEMMKNGFAPIKGDDRFTEAFLWFNASTYWGVLKCAALGCILTFLVQSSSATLGITIGLAVTGAIPFETAAALVLGENIGTTITAWLASIGTTVNAKRAAYAHVLFNLFGVFWITLIFSWYIQWVGAFIQWVHGTNPIGIQYEDFSSKGQYALIVTVGIALTHTGFNITNTLIFLPFVRQFARLLERFVPDKAIKETPHLTSLNMRLVDSPVIGIENSRAEIIKMGRGVDKMLEWTKEIIHQDEPDEALLEKVFHREKIMDNVQAEVIDFLTNLLTGQVPYRITVEGRQQLRISDEYESISDYISNLVKAHLRVKQGDMTWSNSQLSDLDRLHDEVARYVRAVSAGFEASQQDILSRAETQGKSITTHMKEVRDAHLESLSEKKMDPVHSMSFVKMLSAYRKIKDHALNIAEAMANK